MALYLAIGRPLEPLHGKEGVIGSSPMLGLSNRPVTQTRGVHGGNPFPPCHKVGVIGSSPMLGFTPWIRLPA
jgi:hypothetical protein